MKTNEMSYDEIKAALATKGVRITHIAKALKLSPTTVTLTAQGKATSKNVAECIARILDKELHQVFGNKYQEKVENNDERNQQIITAIREGQPIPPAHDPLSIAS